MSGAAATAIQVERLTVQLPAGGSLWVATDVDLDDRPKGRTGAEVLVRLDVDNGAEGHVLVSAGTGSPVAALRRAEEALAAARESVERLSANG